MQAPVETGLICEQNICSHWPHKAHSLTEEPDINKIFTQINIKDKFECHEVQMQYLKDRVCQRYYRNFELWPMKIRNMCRSVE